MQFGRWLAPRLGRALRRPYAHILFGARQTGKSTLLREIIGAADLWIDLADPGQRSTYLARPATFVEECLALARKRGPLRVVVDEAQAVPAIFDGVQHLFDTQGRRFRFILSGSSARKLRGSGANLLPGRAMLHRLVPLTPPERPAPDGAPSGIRAARVDRGVILADFTRGAGGPPFPPTSLVERLTFGELPGIATAHEQDREALLRAYAFVYLEEELRREALIKDWAAFTRFLRLAALESGGIVNHASIASQAAISAPTVKSHYQLLEDMFVGVRVEAFSGSARKHVLSTPRFLLFDLGVRHAAAGLSVSRATVLADPGPVFEQWVGLELWKRLQYRGAGKLTYLRTKAGAEVDWIVEDGKKVVPIEVKWTDAPSSRDARHLRALLAELGPRAPEGYVVCRCERPRRLEDRVTAIPWWMV
jgi:predicted AAA+ superfamily ATPase